MQRDILLLTEMIDAAEQAQQIVHGYWSIDLEVLHTTATTQLPAFANDLRKVLNTVGQGA